MFVLAAAGLFGCQVARPCTVRTYNTPKVRFSTTVGKEPEVEVALVKWKRTTPKIQNCLS